MVDFKSYGAGSSRCQNKVVVNFKIGVVQPASSEIVRMVPSNQIRDELAAHGIRDIAI